MPADRLPAALAICCRPAADGMDRFLLGALATTERDVELMFTDGRCILLTPADLLMVRAAEQCLSRMSSEEESPPPSYIKAREARERRRLDEFWEAVERDLKRREDLCEFRRLVREREAPWWRRLLRRLRTMTGSHHAT